MANGCAFPWVLAGAAAPGAIGCVLLSRRPKAGGGDEDLQDVRRRFEGCVKDAEEARLAGLRATTRYEVISGGPGPDESSFFDDKAAAQDYAAAMREEGFARVTVGKPRAFRKVIARGSRKEVLRLE